MHKIFLISFAQFVLLQTPRPAPDLPQSVHYYTFDELRSAATRSLPAPWTLVSNTGEKLVCTTLSEDFNSVKLKVTVELDLVDSVEHFVEAGGHPAGHLARGPGAASDMALGQGGLVSRVGPDDRD